MRAAELLEKNDAALVSLCLREAGKTRANAIAEVREAVDFCRYYASQALACPPAVVPGGPVVCISPWNFPLAIFVGQVAAALAAGHPVLAKPAKQTPLVAALAVRLFHEAGISRAALQLLPGPGGVVGQTLIADQRIAGVVFTGSTEVAQGINRHIASSDRDVALIAETGGVNAMIVDSSAHLEQVVQDVMSSAFDSAGQRCSALRILCVQEDVFTRLLQMLKRAMRELKIGNPGHLDVDVGPVIDEEARNRLQAHVADFAARQKLYFKMQLPEECGHGSFVAPAILEIDRPGEVKEEVFGPLLHVLRFERQDLGELIEEINALGYGLTFGVQSRIEETIDFAVARIRAGNLYVNRNMIGAVVGVQPFGGEGQSGTGPKAGGPLYLRRLVGCADGVLDDGRDLQGSGKVPESLVRLSEWSLRTGRTRLSHACSEYRACSLFGRTLELPGPTGEANRLSFEPRGLVWCKAGSEDDLFEQFAAIFATGNTPLVSSGALEKAALAKLPRALSDAVVVESHPWQRSDLSCVLFRGPAEERCLLRQQLAAREGAILPLVGPLPGGAYPLFRLVKERTISINTASAGGDPSLMMLGG